ncbi:Glutamate-1-semialdehyde 2,1-aminomutase 1 [subsurface metagenome]
MKYEKIKEDISNIVNNPLRKFKPDKLKEIVKKYTEVHKKSKELFERACKIIPGGVEHNLAFNFPFPLTSKRVDGCYMWTIDDVKLVDFLMNGSPTILGHNYPPHTEKVIEVIKEIGSCHGITNEYEILAAEALQKHFPSCEKIRWLQSGTEADMLAIKVARIFTGKKWVIKIGGGYHGWSDQLVYDLHIPGTKTLESHGIPKPVFKFIESVKPNDIEALRQLFKENKKIAAVLLEPMGPESGENPVRPGFNKELEELCHENGALFWITY